MLLLVDMIVPNKKVTKLAGILFCTLSPLCKRGWKNNPFLIGFGVMSSMQMEGYCLMGRK